MAQGWVKFYRELLEHELWLRDPFTRGQAWTELFVTANHKAKELWLDGSVFKAERGQIVTSMLRLAHRWKWSRDKVRRFLGELEKAQMISLQVDTKKTVITILQYERFQGWDETDQHDTDTLPTTKQQQIDNKPTTNRQRADTNNNDNNVNNDNNEKNNSIGNLLDPRNAGIPLGPFVPVDVHGLIRLTQAEFDSLKAKYGEAPLKALIAEASDFAASKPKKWSTYKSHAAFLRNSFGRKKEKGLVWFVHPDSGPGFYPEWQVQKAKERTNGTDPNWAEKFLARHRSKS